MFVWPVPGPVTRGFHYKSWIYVGGQHAAIDIAAASGTPIVSVADGKVADRGWDALSGNYIAVEHAGDWRSTYRHLRAPAPRNVRVGRGQVIGYVGNTGLSQEPHLHFDLWNRNRISGAFYKNGWYAVDPELYLGQEDDMALTPEQVQLLKNINHYVVIVIPKLLAENDERSQQRYEQLRKDVDAIGTGTGGAHNH